MQIPVQEFGEVLAVLKAGEEGGVGSDQRRAGRIPVQARVGLWPVREGRCQPAVTGLVKDISLTGIGFWLAAPIACGEGFALGLPREKGAPLLVACQSVFCAEAADGIFRIGAEFRGVLSQEQARRLKEA